jgi:kynureninase
MNAGTFEDSLDGARNLDHADELAHLRRAFHLPKHGTRPAAYLSGHSLGLMPRRVRHDMARELERWAKYGVEGHFETDSPGWLDYHARFTAPLARLTGARRHEVVAMNTLTANLHLMLVSFFRPDRGRNKILIEGQAFPSDRYAVQSHLRFHGLDPQAGLLEFASPAGAGLLDAQAFERTLATEGERIALVLLPGVQFLTGQRLDLKTYTRIAHRHGCAIGFDLAHAIGNVPLRLHESGADFAVWCSYKYLNAGPGAVAGCFVHERWAERADLPRFAGWWGHDKASRFDMPKSFAALRGAEGWQLSNPPIFSLVPLAASLDLFETAGMGRLRRKSERLTAYLAYLLDRQLGEVGKLLTPRDRAERGCQLSLRLSVAPRQHRGLIQRLRESGVIADWRPPDVLRLAPVPLYNRFEDVYRAVRALRRALAL